MEIKTQPNENALIASTSHKPLICLVSSTTSSSGVDGKGELVSRQRVLSTATALKNVNICIENEKYRILPLSN